MKKSMRVAFAVGLVAATTLGVRPAPAATEATLVGLQFVPGVVVVDAGTAVKWTNKEAANYPVLIGRHNLIGDAELGGIPGNRAFPVASPLLNPGASWTCSGVTAGIRCVGGDGRAVSIGRGTFAYRCGIHPNQMRGFLIIR